MQVSREVVIAAPASALWDMLWDVRRIVECLPGCVDTRELEPHQRYAARMEQKVGPIRLSVPLDVRVIEAIAPRRLALDAKGRDPVIGAEVVARVALDVVSRGDESVVRIDAEGRILGKLGALGQAVIQRKAEEIIDEFGARLKRAVRGDAA
jgi:carbon monoxide dehydrogenase subunit G